MDRPKLRYAVRNQVEVHVGSLDELLPEDHAVRDIWAYVEEMDLSALESTIRSRQGEAGAPAFDPRTLLCLWVYAMVDGVGSARRLSRLCRESLVYRWITGGEAINYHTLSSFRVECGQVLEDLLVGSVATLVHEGFVDPDSMTVSVDGMRVRASAGRDSTRRRCSLEEALGRAREHVEKLRETDPEPESSAKQHAARARAARERVQRLERTLEVMKEQEPRRKRSDRPVTEPRVSTTDPEATMLRMSNGGKDLAHNIQFAVDTRTRIITHVQVPYRSSDTGTLRDMLDGYQRQYGGMPDQVLADQGFFKYSDIAQVERRGCEVLIPDLYSGAEVRKVAKGDRAYIDRWLTRMNTEWAKQLYKLRSSTVEWANACVRRHGLQQLTVRGQAKARIIGFWHAVAHNIERTIALRRQRTLQESV